MKYLYVFLFSIFALPTYGQEKEVLIIGTMHLVPKLVKRSYKPLLRYALKYEPDAIYVESVCPSDTLSLLNDNPDFVKQSDSLKEIFVRDDQRFAKLDNADLIDFSKDDFEFMSQTYLVNRDYANYSYYSYLTKYGVEGSPQPLRNENADLSAKLAIALNLRYIHSMDDQQNRPAYHDAWSQCVELGDENGDNEINNKLSKKLYMSAVFPALLGRFGKHTNRPKILNRFHSLNSFRYVQNSQPACENATKYWDERNFRMAKNIAEQINQGTEIKNIVMVGAGHVIGLKEALEKNYPELKVKIMYD